VVASRRTLLHLRNLQSQSFICVFLLCTFSLSSSALRPCFFYRLVNNPSKRLGKDFYKADVTKDILGVKQTPAESAHDRLVEMGLRENENDPDDLNNIISIEFEGFTGFRPYMYQGQLEKQAAYAAQFASDMYASLGGNTAKLPFRQIIIRPMRGSGGKTRMQVEGNQLIIAMPVVPIYGARVLTNRQLNRLWKEGVFLEQVTEYFILKKDGPLRKRWYFLNPVGEFRTTARRELGGLLKRLHGIADNLLTSVERITTPADAEARILENVDKDKLDPRNLAFLKNLEPGQRKELIELWQAEMRNPLHTDGIVDGAVVKALDADSAEVNYDVENKGWIAVQNIHDITISFGSPYVKYFGTEDGKVKSDPGSTDRPTMRMRNVGRLVAVNTVDRIRIHLNLKPEVIGTATLDAALTKMREASEESDE